MSKVLEEAIGWRTPETASVPFSHSPHIPTNSLFGLGLSPDAQLLFIKALIAALTSGLGGVPLWLLGKGGLSQRVMGFCIIFAAGLMTGCSVVLFMEGLEHTTLAYAVGWALLGVGLIDVVGRCVGETEDFEFGGLQGKDAGKALLVVLSMGLHSLGEGISVGVSAQSEYNNIGLLVIVSLAIHNIPEGIATAILLMSRGMSVGKASFCSVLANLPQPLIAVPAFLFMDRFEGLLPVGFSLAAGAMTYIVCTELIPESKEKLSRSLLVSTFCTSLGIIVAISVCARHA